MNPYLEQDGLRNDFHLTFIVSARQALVSQITGRYFSRLEPHAVPEIDRRSYIALRDLAKHRLVTVIEVMRMDVKETGQLRDGYLAQRKKWLRAGVHLVEIDLIRGGNRLSYGALPESDYLITVCRQPGDGTRVEAWPVSLRDRLPVVPIPLIAGDDELLLDLQQVLHRAYDSAGYEYHVYNRNPEPPLSPEDAAWAAQFLPARP
jgi:hypothetical protein